VEEQVGSGVEEKNTAQRASTAIRRRTRRVRGGC